MSILKLQGEASTDIAVSHLATRHRFEGTLLLTPSYGFISRAHVSKVSDSRDGPEGPVGGQIVPALPVGYPPT